MNKKELEKYKPYEIQMTSNTDMFCMYGPMVKVSLKVSLLLNNNKWRKIKLPGVMSVSKEIMDDKKMLDTAIKSGIEEIERTLKQGWMSETIIDDDGNEKYEKIYFKGYKIIKE